MTRIEELQERVRQLERNRLTIEEVKALRKFMEDNDEFRLYKQKKNYCSWGENPILAVE